MLLGQTTTWLLHVHEHLPRLNVAPYSLEMSENIGKFMVAYLLESYYWQEIFSVVDCELRCDELFNTFWTMFYECFPLISVRTSSRDPPFISPLVKYLWEFTNRLQKRSKLLPVGLEDRINHLIDFSKAFDSVSHNILCSKLKQVNINPYINNWLISFLHQRKQRVVVDGYRTKYVSINRGVAQGTVLGPVLFSIFINDIKAVNTNKNLLVKFADDITVSLPIEANVGLDESETEVLSFVKWSENNCMKVNLTKTWELLLRGKTTRTPPEPLEIIGRKEKLKLLGVTFEQVPVNWDTHIDYLLSKASSRLYIIRICKYYGYSRAFGLTFSKFDPFSLHICH